jgi:CxxC-x17-CxxC domain-containing protein
MPADTLLTCRDCSSSFTFTRSEQRLYASLGFNRPARCEACRATRQVERSRTSGSAPTAGAGASSSGVREMFSTSCASCGREARVPFEPYPNRRVYCSECYEVRSRAARAEAKHA